jgi:chemotaxis protein methyltransferase CheR
MTLALADFAYVRDLVRQQSAIVLGDDKSYLVESRLGPVARGEGLPSLAALVERLRGAAATELRRKVVEALTTNETSFFRDIKPFEALRRVILPELFAGRAPARQLRIWCAACSTGQEPYSIALLLREDFQAYLRWNIQLLATDICRDLIARAREGRFSQLEVNRGLPARLLLHHFVQVGRGEWQCKEEVRNLVQFRHLNLIDPWPPMPAQDVIFLRNVLIYFNNETKQQILAKVRRILSPDGYLFLGGAETTLNLDDGFVRQEVAGTSCYRLK